MIIKMAAPYTVNIFIPHHIINECNSCYLFGYESYCDSYALFNCSISYSCSITNSVNVELFSKYIKDETLKDYNKSISFLGVFYECADQNLFDSSIIKTLPCGLKFILSYNTSKDAFHLETLQVMDEREKICSQIIVYNGYDLRTSKLLIDCSEKNICDQNNTTFVKFLVKTVDLAMSEKELDFGNQLHSSRCKKYLPVEDHEEIRSLYFIFQSLFIIIWKLFCTILLYLEHIFYLFFQWWPAFLTQIVVLSSVGKHIHQRFLDLSDMCKELKNGNPVTLGCRNLMCAVLLDLAFGWIVTYYLWHYDLPHKLLELSMKHTNDVVDGLHKLIYWLMGVPAGLKLNIPLNSSLGHFFLYYIYLWKTYIIMVVPFFSAILEKSSLIGVFGITFIFSLVNDLISIATIHIYCFYGYAARLYGYQMSSLCALWRLFRGKKWNPLRQRVDSYTYDVYQLYIGTLIFTVLLFLLPTIVTYYTVFTSLRVMVLMLQGVISRLVNVLSICPVYAVILRLFNSSETTGDIYFSILNNKEALVLTMQAVQIPLSSVIKATMPKLHHYKDTLSWKDFLSSLIWGKIIYPL